MRRSSSLTLARRTRNAQAVKLLLEILEDRLCPTTGLIDFTDLQLDPNTYNTDQIIVRFDSDLSQAQTNQLYQSILAGSSGRPLLSTMPSLQLVTLPGGVDLQVALNAFESDSHVLYAQPDYKINVHATIPNDFRYGEMWGLENTGQTGGTADDDIDAARAWDVNTGSGSTIIAVLDTGVEYTHPDLQGNMWINPGEVAGDGIDNDGNGFIDDVHGWDFFNNDNDPMDDNGHGTHVAGTIGAVGNNGLGVTGINWNIQIMALKFLGADGSGSESDAILALDYAISNGATISNNSWGGDPPSQALFDAITAAKNADHIFVTAAGNGNAFGIGQNNDIFGFYPGNYDVDNIITVAAMDHDGGLGVFSNFGEFSVDLAAPGVDILSTTLGGSYVTASGTSMATPHVAGVIALVRDLHPTWTYNQVINQVLSTVEVTPELQGVTITGGRLNAAAAMGNPEAPLPPPPAVNLPLVDDFGDGLAQGFIPQIGGWDVDFGKYAVRPIADYDNLEAISTFNLAASLPSNFAIETTVNTDEGRIEVLGFVIQDYLTNGFIIFDYHSRTDYKFAGVDMVQDRWVIGHRDVLGWHTDAFVSQALDPNIDYHLRLVVDNSQTVTLVGDGSVTVSHTFESSVNDGKAGLGMRNSSTRFDNVAIKDNTPVTPGDLPLSEDFSDGVAQHFQAEKGYARVENGRMELFSFAGQDNIQTIALNGSLPANLELQAKVNANDIANGFVSNAFLIFDYQSPTDFKYAGAYIGGDKWGIGHRNVSGWVADKILVTPLSPLTDYNLRVVIESNGDVTLYGDGVPQLTHNFGEALTDGLVGIGTDNSITRFDDVVVKAHTPPPTTSLPLDEDFQDGNADYFDPRLGLWAVSAGRYQATPTGQQDPISELLVNQPLPTNLRFDATIQTDPQTSAFFSNAFLIFDYHSPTDFKYAGAFIGGDKWAIGHRDSSGWTSDVILATPLSELTDYNVGLEIEADSTVTFYVNGLPQISHTFSDSLTDGRLALGSNVAIARFDNVHVEEVLPPDPPTQGTLPLSENFDDGKADHFQEQLGVWTVANNEFEVAPLAGKDGISTVLLLGSLPANVEIQATINADNAAAGYVSNGFIIFDYQSPTNFKYAGAYVGGDKWGIGRRDASGWKADQLLVTPLSGLTDYDLRVVLESDGTVTLFGDGVPQLTHNYGESLTDGLVGIGTQNSVTRFDDFVVQEYTPPAPTSLPLQEDFQDGNADYFNPALGQWTVSSGRYQATPSGQQDPISILLVNKPLPDNLRLSATVQSDPQTAAFFSNAFLIFDYQSPTDFKYAGAFIGGDKWAIGHRDSSGWVSDVTLVTPLSELTDYNLSLEIGGGATATLFVNGLPQVSYTYAESLTDGDLALGSNIAVARFDNVLVEEITPPSPPTPGTLPLAENFNDNEADHFQSRLGIWSVANGRYQVTPVLGQDGISTLLLSDLLPAGLEIQVTINADDTSSGYLSNAFVIFDYQSPTDFKFAGAFVGVDKWAIGHRDGSGWVIDSLLVTQIDPNVDYDLRVVIENSNEVSLYAGGIFQAGHTYSGSVVDGQIGLGTQQAISRFDDFTAQAFSLPSTGLPVQEDFQDGQADFFEVRIGTWEVTAGRYQVTPTPGNDGISTLRINEAVPGNFEFSAILNGNSGTVEYLSNGFLIFDYHGPEDFKFAGTHLGSDRWLVGHRDSNGWVMDAWINTPIAANTDYQLRLVVTNHTDVTLYADGVPQVSYSFSDAVTDGKLGLGTDNAVTRFDNVLVQQYTQPTAATIPYSENFNDGVADHLQVRAGSWTITSGRYGVTPEAAQDGVSTINFSDPLPPNLDVRTLMNANPGESGYWSNAFIIFDYQGPTNFKYAGAFVGGNRWAIGTRNSSGWSDNATFLTTINALADYNLRLVVQNGTNATLYVNGAAFVSFNYAQSVVDGQVGIGTVNAISRFDNLVVKPYLSGGAQIQSADFIVSGANNSTESHDASSPSPVRSGAANDEQTQKITAALNQLFSLASSHRENKLYSPIWQELFSSQTEEHWSKPSDLLSVLRD